MNFQLLVEELLNEASAKCTGPTKKTSSSSKVCKCKSGGCKCFSKKDSVDVMIYYTIGKTAEEVDYCHTVIKDNNDIHSKGVSFDDPQSEELSSFASSKGINIGPDDIEMAGQDGYSKIEEYINQPDETGEAYEESFKFEKLFQSIVNEEKS